MRNIFHRTLAVLPLVLLASCGAGGDIGNTTSEGDYGDSVFIVVNPASAQVTTVEGFGYYLTVESNITGTAADNTGYSLRAVDPDHILGPFATEFSANGGKGAIKMFINNQLSPGIHKGTVTFQACSRGCKKIDGSTDFTITVTVQPQVHLTTLKPFTGLADWHTERGDNEHDNYVPVTLDPTKFNPRWVFSVLNLDTYPKQRLAGTNALTDSANHVVVTQSESGLIAFDEKAGKELWHVEPTEGEPGYLALYNGIVYTTARDSTDTHLEAFNVSDGSLLFDVPVGCGGCNAGTPIVVGTTVYLMVDRMRTFDATTGAPVWVGPDKSSQGSPAADAQNVYFYQPNQASPGVIGDPGLTALDQATGTLLWEIDRAADPVGTNPLLLSSTPVLDGNGGAIIKFNSDSLPIERYDVTTHQRIWSTGFSGSVRFYQGAGAIAVANGRVYGSTDDYGIAALDLSTGDLLWKWYPPVRAAATYLLVTKNLLFVATQWSSNEGKLYAVDLATHKTVWDCQIDAEYLSISPSGILYVGAPGFWSGHGALMAVNLH